MFESSPIGHLQVAQIGPNVLYSHILVIIRSSTTLYKLGFTDDVCTVLTFLYMLFMSGIITEEVLEIDICSYQKVIPQRTSCPYYGLWGHTTTETYKPVYIEHF